MPDLYPGSDLPVFAPAAQRGRLHRGRCWPYGVRADVFVPFLPPLVPFERNAVFTFDDYDMHHVVARELLMSLHDVQPAGTQGDAPSGA